VEVENMVNVKIDTEKMVCPCCGRVFPTDKGGARYCPTCIRYCDGDGCYVGKEKPKSIRPYILKVGGKPAVAIYTRCEDPLFSRAELLLTMNAMKPEQCGKACLGYYDDDPTFTVEEFLRGYVEDKRMPALLNKLKEIRQNGWKYKHE
jgi:hypothetical protein